MTDWVADGIAGGALLVSGVAAWYTHRAGRYRPPWTLTVDGERYLLTNNGSERALAVEVAPAAAAPHGVQIMQPPSLSQIGPGEAVGFIAGYGFGLQDDRVVVRWRRPRRWKRLTWAHPLPRKPRERRDA